MASVTGKRHFFANCSCHFIQMPHDRPLEVATALYREGKLQEAAQVCQELLSSKPSDAKALTLLGAVALQIRPPEQALALLSRAAELDASDAFTHSLLGNVRLKRGDLAGALHSYDQALSLAPRYVDAYYNRGCALLDCGRFEDAIGDFDRAVELNPGFAPAYLNKGVALAGAGQVEAAIPWISQAIAKDPGDAHAYYNRARAWHELRHFPEAIDDYDRAIGLEPGYSAAYLNRAVSRLTQGRLLEGWRDMEWRWIPGGSSLATERRDFLQPQWQGEQPVAGKTILIHCEQGLGDTLQFCRYVPMVAALGAKVVLEVPAALRKLLSSLPGVDHMVTRGDALPDFHWHCPLLSLPLAFRTSLETIPAAVPYLQCDIDRLRHWEQRLGTRRALRVGLVWSGGHRPNRPDLWDVNSRRNLPLSKLAVLKMPGVEFFSLQKGEPAESEFANTRAIGWSGPDIRDFGTELQDFVDTAALIEQLDLVISVDTSVAHLAGALGKPVWILNRFDGCWRWLLNRSDSPWYPSARLYTQPQPGDWDGALTAVAIDLSALARRHPVTK